MLRFLWVVLILLLAAVASAASDSEDLRHTKAQRVTVGTVAAVGTAVALTAAQHYAEKQRAAKAKQRIKRSVAKAAEDALNDRLRKQASRTREGDVQRAIRNSENADNMRAARAQEGDVQRAIRNSENADNLRAARAQEDDVQRAIRKRKNADNMRAARAQHPGMNETRMTNCPGIDGEQREQPLSKNTRDLPFCPMYPSSNNSDNEDNDHHNDNSAAAANISSSDDASHTMVYLVGSIVRAAQRAGQKGSIKTIGTLLARGAPPDETNDDRITALMVATANGHLALMRLLIRYGANVQASDVNGKTSLMMAALNSTPARREICNVLLVAGADVNARDVEGLTSLMCAESQYRDDTGVISDLLQAGADVNASQTDGRTALMHAASRGEKACFNAFMDAGGDINAMDNDGVTVLMYTAGGSMYGRRDSESKYQYVRDVVDRERHEMVRRLLAAGANVNGISDNGSNALIFATRARHRYVPSIVDVLLDAGADIAAADDNGCTPLMYAALTRVTVVSRLLAAGADIEAADDDGWTALMYAAREGPDVWTDNMSDIRTRIVGTLLVAGANVNATSHDGSTSLILATIAEHQWVPITVSSLLKAGANVNAADNHGNTPLMYAASTRRDLPNIAAKGYVDVVSMLLTSGASINATNNDGSTAIMSAAGAVPPDLPSPLPVVSVPHVVGGFLQMAIWPHAEQSANCVLIEWRDELGGRPQLPDGKSQQRTWENCGAIRASIGLARYTELDRLMHMRDSGNDTELGRLMRLPDGGKVWNMDVEHKYGQRSAMSTGKQYKLNKKLEEYYAIKEAASSAIKQHVAVVSTLLAAGASDKATTNDGLTALDIAFCKGHVAIATVILIQGPHLLTCA